MKILVLSDSHGKTNLMHKIILKEKADMILHLGDTYADFEEIRDIYDIPSYGVKGNVDYYSNGPSYDIIEVLNKKIFITHGHEYRVKRNIEFLLSKASEFDADIVLYGHTHISSIIEGNVFVMNPGSISEPRSETYPSYGIINIKKSETTGNIIFVK